MAGRKMKVSDYDILIRIKEGKYPAQIAKELGLSREAIRKRLKKLEELGLIREIPKTYPKLYELTPKGIIYLNQLERLEKETVNNPSLPVTAEGGGQPQPFLKGTINFHDFKIKVPILREGHIPDNEIQQDPHIKDKKIVPMRNWLKQYLFIELPNNLDVTVEITTKSVIIHFHSKEFRRDLGFWTYFLQWVFKTIIAVNYILNRYNYVVDWFNLEVISQHIATQVNDKIDERIPDKTKIEVDLNRKAESITPMEQEAKAWIDKSQGKAEIETNDLLYEEKLLLMPEKVFEISNKIEEILKKYNLTNEEIRKIKEDILKDMHSFAKFANAHVNLIQRMNVLLDMLIAQYQHINQLYSNINSSFNSKQSLINISNVLTLIWQKTKTLIMRAGKFLLRLVSQKN